MSLLDDVAAAALQPATPAPPPLELVLDNCRIQVGRMKRDGHAVEETVILVTHHTGGFRVVVPMSDSTARRVGNTLAGKPAIVVPAEL